MRVISYRFCIRMCLLHVAMAVIDLALFQPNVMQVLMAIGAGAWLYAARQFKA